METYPDAQLIVAHAGIADLGALMRHFAGKPGVFFDTSAWSPIDLLDFFRQVSPEQVLYASDYPYGQQPTSLLIALRTARTAGLDDVQLRGMLVGNADADRGRPAAARDDAGEGERHLHASRWCSPHPPVPVDGERRCSGHASPTRSASSDWR